MISKEKRRRLGVFCGLLAAGALTGCLAVQSVSISQVPEASQRKRLVKAEASRPTVLFIPFGTSYVDEARKSLLAKCPDGAIEGLLSKHEEVDYFLHLVVVSSLSLRGYCVAEAKASKKSGKASRKSKRI